MEEIKVNGIQISNKGVLSYLVHFLSNNFSADFKKVDNPFIMSNADRAFKNIMFNNNKSKELQQIKKDVLQNFPFSLKTVELFFFDGDKEFSFIDYKNIEEAFAEYPELLKPMEFEEITATILHLAKEQIINDKQVTILREIQKNFVITYGGFLKPKPQADTVGGILEKKTDDIQKILYLFSLPYPAFYQHARQFDRDMIDEVLIAKEMKHYRNEKLEKQFGNSVPLLVREHLLGKDGKHYKQSLRQMYKSWHMMDNQFTFNACPRQVGKTFDASKDGLMAILCEGTNNVRYVCVNEEVFYQPWEYMTNGYKKFQDFGILTLLSSENEVVCNLTGNTIKLISAASKMGTRSFNGELFIIDEGGFIQDKAWYDMLPIIENNNAKVIVNSTINREMKKSKTEWFWQELANGELGQDDDIFVLRVNIDQVEWLDKKKVDRLKKRLMRDYDRYLAELYSVVPSGDESVFPEGFFVIGTPEKDDTHQYLIGRDLAKKHDSVGIVVLDMQTGHFVEEHKMINTSYLKQIEFIKYLKQWYGNAKVIADISNEETFLEYNPGLVDYAVTFTTSTTSAYEREGSTLRYRIGKEVLVNTFVNLAEQGDIKAYQLLSILMQESKQYAAIKLPSGRIRYEATAGTDDVVSAAIMTAFIYNEVRLKHKKMLDIIKQRNAARNNLDNLESRPKKRPNRSHERMAKFCY